MRKIELLVATLIFLAFTLLITNYYAPDLLRRAGIQIPSSIRSTLREAYRVDDNDRPALNSVTINVPGGHMYRAKAEPSLWLKIYDTYPLHGKGKENIYTFLEEGDFKTADKFIDNVFYIDRSKPVKIASPIQWTEDPYKDRYWRFIFYSLRSTRHLLYAFKESGNKKYARKDLEIVESFIDRGMNKTHAWDDYHGVAFRTMVLVDTWWKLREDNALPVDASTKILKALERHGEFLEDETHYEGSYNHGINEAAALYLLAVSFPDLPKAREWLSVAKGRLVDGLNDVVDDDGLLVENSPYYHFYILGKYWEIYRYSKAFNAPISGNFNAKIAQMVSYGTYILQPNSSLPLLGASLATTIHNAGRFAEMADENPNFLYVLTHGTRGTRPSKTNISFKTAGQTVMRSDWGNKVDYKNQTQLVFTVGPYRTTHSQLDKLSFSLFGAGIPLMPDSGLYSYSKQPFKAYFRGTSAHNTVVIDGRDQNPGSTSAGKLHEGNGFTYQTAQQDLYPGVKAARTLALIKKRFVLVIDKLSSDKPHTYDQLFHLFPEAKLTVKGLTVTGTGASPSQAVTIHQLSLAKTKLTYTKGQTSPLSGWYSSQYEKAVPNYAISYEQKGKEATFYTLLEIGKPDTELSTDIKTRTGGVCEIKIRSRAEDYSITLENVPGKERVVKVQKLEQRQKQAGREVIDTFQNVMAWKSDDSAQAAFLAYKSQNTFENRPALTITAPANGRSITVKKKMPLDLSKKNIRLKMKVKDIANATDLRIMFSNKNWSACAYNLLKNAYRTEYEGEWITVSFGKGSARDRGGQWQQTGQTFDWSAIDQVGFEISAKKGKSASLSLAELSTISEQKTGSVIITFDDGSTTILPALKIMNKYGVKGNVAVIGERPAQKAKGYLSLSQLKRLQNEYGWNLINHSAHHKNALNTYYATGNMQAYEKDVLDGFEYLEKNGIDSDPNWYIFPNGATNGPLEAIVGKYYSFARTVRNEPEVFPFGDPLNVKVFSATGGVPPSAVHKAVEDALKYKHTLFLVFHRIWTGSSKLPSDSYYRASDFEAVIKDIANQKIDVRTYSELDRANGVPTSQVSLTEATPNEVKLMFKIDRQSWIESLDSGWFLRFSVALAIGLILLFRWYMVRAAR